MPAPATIRLISISILRVLLMLPNKLTHLLAVQSTHLLLLVLIPLVVHVFF